MPNQKWEYAFVLMGAGSESPAVVMPGQQPKKVPGDIPQLLNSLGDSGWELVTDAQDGTKLAFVMKRAKS